MACVQYCMYVQQHWTVTRDDLATPWVPGSTATVAGWQGSTPLIYKTLLNAPLPLLPPQMNRRPCGLALQPGTMYTQMSRHISHITAQRGEPPCMYPQPPPSHSPLCPPSQAFLLHVASPVLLSPPSINPNQICIKSFCIMCQMVN